MMLVKPLGRGHFLLARFVALALVFLLTRGQWQPARPEPVAARRTRDFVAAHADRIAFLNVALFNLPVASAEAQSSAPFALARAIISVGS